MRSIWTGSISFGLVSIPVKMYSASRDRALKFKLLDREEHCPISYKKVCREDDKPVKQEDIVKGFEYEKGKFVVLEDDDFKRANAKKTETIDIVSFAHEDEIEGKYYDKPYYLEPEKRGAKAYALLREALKESKKVGIAKFVMREKEHIGVVKTDGDILELVQLPFQDQIVDPEELALPPKSEHSKRELDIALSLIEKLTEKFKIGDYKDTYTEELLKVIKQKAKGKKFTAVKHETTKPTEATELLEALRKSLDEEKTAKKH